MFSNANEREEFPFIISKTPAISSDPTSILAKTISTAWEFGLGSIKDTAETAAD